VTLDFVLRDDRGNELQRSAEGQPLVYLHGAHNVVPGLEEALEGKAEGEELSVTVPPEKGYGSKRNIKSQRILRSKFPEHAKIEKGMRFVMHGPDGQPFPIWVTKVQGREVHVSPEHPMSGKTLCFDVKVLTIRDATDEERKHGHAHGPGAHEHGDEA
jgi:FKBP-type peptidyl-prolyl cis-trans isomerase SlyD